MNAWSSIYHAAWTILCLVVLALPAAGQTVPLRSGAHDGFDRIVLDMPRHVTWRMVRHEQGASLVFDDTRLRFDPGAVFERIGRTRLRAITAPAGGGRLDLEFACDCRLTPFWHQGNMLVIDISEPPPDKEASSVHPRQRPSAGRVGDRWTWPPFPSSAGAALAARLDEKVGPRLSALPDATNNAPARNAARDAMRTALAQQIGRAASQGLVTPAPDRRDGVTSPFAEPPVPSNSTAPPRVARAVPHDETGPGGPAAPGLRITTAMDRDLAASTRATPEAEVCPPQPEIDVASWGGSGPFAVELGRLNAALYGEFDTIQKDDALDLARLYIFHGFGVEARQVLGWLDAGSRDIALARELSMLVEGAPLPVGARLTDALGCGEPAVLWAILAPPQLPREVVFDHRALQRAFVSLPDGLRRVLGPALVQRLVAAGHRRTADAILRHLRGGDVVAAAETGLARAALAEQRGEDGVAQASLRAATDANTEQTGVALAETIERALAREAPIAFDDAQLAGALAFEHRNTPLGERLAQAYLAALAASGTFDEAMTEFDRLRPTISETAAGRVASVLAGYLLRQADDVTFLRAVMADRISAPAALEGDVALGLARRLLALGFPKQAARYVGPEQGADPGEGGVARRLVRARIALAQNRPATALRNLLGLDDDEADLLRAEALAAQDDNAAARRLFDASGATRRADRAALRTGRAAVISQAEDPALRELGALLASDPVAQPDAQGLDIEARRAVLSRSTALRVAMKRLLAATTSKSVAPERRASFQP